MHVLCIYNHALLATVIATLSLLCSPAVATTVIGVLRVTLEASEDGLSCCWVPELQG